MATHGLPIFQTYARNLRRIYWTEFIDVQTERSRANQAMDARTPDRQLPKPAPQNYQTPIRD
jgi:hypothetical protein